MVYTLVIVVHILAALIALVSGIAAISVQRVSRWHRPLGKLYLGA